VKAPTGAWFEPAALIFSSYSSSPIQRKHIHFFGRKRHRRFSKNKDVEKGLARPEQSAGNWL
jgi:hypothetical protein